MPAQEQAGMDLRAYLSVIRRRKWVIVLIASVSTVVATVLSLLQTPVYEAGARVLLQPSQSLFGSDLSTYVDSSQVETEIQVIQAEPVQKRVREKLGGAAPPISASTVGSAAVILLAARSTNPHEAARVANAYAEAYTEFRLGRAVDTLLAAVKEIQLKIDDLDRQIQALDAPPAPDERAPAAPAASVQSSQREGLESQRSAYKEKFDELQVEKSLKDGGAQVVAPAVAPASPVGPSPVRNGLLGLIAGLIFGTAAAFLVDHLDDSIKTKADLERSVRDVPTLAMIPVVTHWKSRSDAFLVSSSEPSSAAAEAYRSLRTSIQFLALDQPLRTLQITSPAASEGKTTTIANLAVVLARTGKRVVIASCDLRRPRVHSFFGISNAIGFTSVLLGDTPLSAALQAVPDQSDLFILATGPLPPNPSELLASKRTGDVLAALQERADIVLVDSPPVLPVTDAAVLATHVDATVLVATADSTKRRALTRALELLRGVDAPLIGTVLNRVAPEGTYDYYYYHPEEPEPGKREPKAKRRASASVET